MPSRRVNGTPEWRSTCGFTYDCNFIVQVTSLEQNPVIQISFLSSVIRNRRPPHRPSRRADEGRLWLHHLPRGRHSRHCRLSAAQAAAGAGRRTSEWSCDRSGTSRRWYCMSLPNCVTPKDALKFRWPVESSFLWDEEQSKPFRQLA